MALNPYINSFDTQAEYEEYLDGSTAKAPNVAYIRATDTMKYTKSIPNPTWLIYGTTSGTTDFIIGSSRKGINLHVEDGIFYATAEDVVGTPTSLGFNTTEGKKITKLKRWTYPNTNVKDMSNMFNFCSNLTSIDLSSFNTSNATSMNQMFYMCSSLTSLDLTNFDTTNVGPTGEMFFGCTKLNKLILGTGFFNSTSASILDIGGASAWTDADSLETFVKAAEVHDGTGKTIKLSPNTKNALTQAQKDRITGAGWTIG